MTIFCGKYILCSLTFYIFLMYWHDTLVWPFASCRMAGVVWLYAYWRASFGIYETNHYVCHHLLYHHHFWCWPCPWSPSFSIMICVSFVCKEFIIELGVWLHLFVGICLLRDIKLWWLFSSLALYLPSMACWKFSILYYLNVPPHDIPQQTKSSRIPHFSLSLSCFPPVFIKVMSAVWISTLSEMEIVGWMYTIKTTKSALLYIIKDTVRTIVKGIDCSEIRQV